MGNLLFHNYFLEKGISINDIPLEHKEILKELINKVQILNYTYICKYCNEIPKIDITYNQKNVRSRKKTRSRTSKST